jgi:glycosyltransferase involved in cell wall biosynthesis
VIAFASFEGFAGCVTSARHAAAVLGGAAHALAPGDPPPPCDLLVLSSWHESYEPLLDATPRVVARWHSPLLQTELSAEQWKVERLLELRAAGRIAAIACDDAGTAHALGAVHLPNVLAPVAPVEARALDGINVTLLGEPYPRKNVLTQAAAFARAAQPDWTLHLAGHERHREWLERLGLRFVVHGRLRHDDVLALIAGADAGLAATVSESYGYLAAEHLQLGTPVITSPAVKCADTGSLCVADPGDVDALAQALQSAIGADLTAARRSLAERAAQNERVARAGLRCLSPESWTEGTDT